MSDDMLIEEAIEKKPRVGRRVLVTGGCGFIGHNLCLHLLKEGFDVYCVDRQKADFIDMFPEIGFIQQDLATLDTAQLPGKIDAIVHLATTTVPETSNKDVLYDVQSNVESSIKLLNFARDNNISRFVFMSSGGTVYGNPQKDEIDESHPTNPICSYGISKLAVEKYAYLYKQLYGMTTISLRLSNPYGRYQNPKSKQGIIPIFCSKALNDEEIQVFGDGTIERDFLYIDDVCYAVQRAIDVHYDRIKDVSAVNIGSGRGTSINEILYTLSTLLDTKLKVRYLPARSFDVKKNVLKYNLANDVLAWSPFVPLTDGIQKTLDYMEQVKLEK